MLLTTALLFSALGFACWVGGVVLDQPEVAVIGGILVVGMGAMVANGGLEYRDGQIETTDPDTNTTTVEHTYSTAETPQQLSFAALIMILGGVITIQSINRFG